MSAEQLQAEGRLLCLDCLTRAGSHRVLLAHEGSGARVWDLRYAPLQCRQDMHDIPRGVAECTLAISQACARLSAHGFIDVSYVRDQRCISGHHHIAV